MAAELLDLANLVNGLYSDFNLTQHLAAILSIDLVTSTFDQANHEAIALIAQARGQFNQDVVGDMAKGWNNFIRTGQWAALLIGLAIGYMFRVFTSSG
ncbi:MAG: hypothetical protein SFT94_08725 [Pseudanabaenaceae cyanobacterium bins.68]|nr:hypothetical protein [Pseudanabaenaceae cyanobacterium bins.68]